MPKPVLVEDSVELDCTRAQLWPLVADTEGMNRVLGLPVVTYEAKEEATGGSVVTARARYMGLPIEWREYPFEWVEPQQYSVRRVYSRGPLDEVRAFFRLDDLGARCRFQVRIEMQPNLLGALFAKGLARDTLRGFLDLASRMAASIQGKGENPLAMPPASPVEPEALAQKLTRLRENGVPPALIDRLREWIATAPDRELARARPFALADRWNLPREDVLRAFLVGTRAGLFEMRWDIVCPQCRKAEDRLDTLSKLPKQGH